MSPRRSSPTAPCAPTASPCCPRRSPAGCARRRALRACSPDGARWSRRRSPAGRARARPRGPPRRRRPRPATGAPTAAAVPHVVGVVTEDGDEMSADLVVDAGGRRSPVPPFSSRRSAVRRPGRGARTTAGFVYYGRHFRSPDGSMPVIARRRPCSPTTRSRSSPCPPTTAPGAWASWPAPTTTPCGRARHLGGVRARRAQLPTRRPLDARRSDHRHRHDGQDRGPPPPVLGRRPPGGHRTRRRRRRLGLHQPVGRARRLDRPAAMPSPSATCCARSGTADPSSSPSASTRSPPRPSSRSSATRWPSTAIAWPRSTPRSPAAPTRPTTRAGSSASRSLGLRARDPDLLRAYLERRHAARPRRRRPEPPGSRRAGRRAGRRQADAGPGPRRARPARLPREPRRLTVRR